MAQRLDAFRMEKHAVGLGFAALFWQLSLENKNQEIKSPADPM